MSDEPHKTWRASTGNLMDKAACLASEPHDSAQDDPEAESEPLEEEPGGCNGCGCFGTIVLVLAILVLYIMLEIFAEAARYQ